MLEKKFRTHEKPIEIINKDVLELDNEFFTRFDVIIGNIPYEISSPLLFKLWDENHHPNILLTVQKEFAQRLTAQCGTQDYSRLGVMSQIFSSPVILKIYPPSALYPVPKVAHAVVWLKPAKNENTSQIVKQFRPQFSKFMIQLFNRKNKRAVNSLDPFIKKISPKSNYKAIIAEMRGKDLFNKRVKDLTPVECVQLFQDSKSIRRKIKNQ